MGLIHLRRFATANEMKGYCDYEIRRIPLTLRVLEVRFAISVRAVNPSIRRLNHFSILESFMSAGEGGFN
jgi:hypothetical protein